MQLSATHLSAGAGRGRPPFSPPKIPGLRVWYDPSDYSTMFQDAAGTVPVTAVEQQVGRMLDKSGQGKHATQFTATSRPILRARYNVLVGTETLATQSITSFAAAYTFRHDGPGTVTLSGTATGTYAAGTHSVTCTAGTLTLTVSGTVSKADLRVTGDGLGSPDYQRVTTNTDYDTVGFFPYLFFDGFDDVMTATGVAFSQAPHAVILGASTNKNISDLIGTGGTNAGNALLMLFNSRARAHEWQTGALVVADTPVVPLTPAPVVVGQIRRATTLSALLNGVESSIALAGTPATPSSQFVLGHRSAGGGSDRLHGRIYQVVVLAAEPTASDLAKTLAFVNRKTGAY